MESPGGSSNLSSAAAATVSAAMPSPSNVADSSKAANYEFDPSIAEEEKRFYVKAYPTVDIVRDRKTHCTVCKTHIGTAPVQENGIKMHPILRVTHCNKCHDFYNSGEFSKGEDGSELYCRWCGQGGEVYCCSSCPYVFCKSCIIKNLSRGVVADIEQNENWNCFSCAPKILWPLRAQHWALMNYIEQQKKEIYAMNLNENDLKQYLSRDNSKCCRLAKAKCGNMSDSMESLDSIASKRSHGSTSGSAKKLPVKHAASPQQMNPAKRPKTNDEVVCTPDLLSMLEPDCQITVAQKPNRPMPSPSASTPKIMSIQQPQASSYGGMSSTPKNTAPPPLVLRNTAIKLRPVAPQPVVRRTIIGPRTPTPGGGNSAPVYHTINGYRIDLNSAAQQETFRLPNGKLIQVKRQGPPAPQNAAHLTPPTNSWQQQMNSPQQQRIIPQTIASRPVQITQHPYNITVQQQQSQQGQQISRPYGNNMIGSTTINAVNHNGTSLQVVNGQLTAAPQQHQQQQQPPQQQQQTGAPLRPVMIRHVFPDTPIGQARTGLQEQVFNAMEICTHLTNKVQTLTNSNAYKQARNYLEVKELYIHLSYLLTYAIGRFKGLQDKCLGDMRTLGFGNDADSLENGQLAADKQASDDEDNEIEIVEPKTDLITLDSDDDEPNHPSPVKIQAPPSLKIQKVYNNSNVADVKVKPFNVRASIAQVPAQTSAIQQQRTPPQQSQTLQTIPSADENMDLMSMAQSFLASMLEVDIHEGSFNTPGLDSTGHKKQPRKKLTNKPNPTLLKQKALMERERLEEMKRNDQKLKMKCAVALKKAEDEFPYAKEMLEAKAKEIELQEKDRVEKESQNRLVIDDGKKLFEVEVILEDDVMNSSTEEQNTKANDESTEKVLSKESEMETETKKSEEPLKEDVSTEKINRKSIEEITNVLNTNEANEVEMETKKSEETIKEDETINSSTNMESNDETVNELSNKENDAVKEIEETPEEAKDTDETQEISENPKDVTKINNETEISEELVEEISEKIIDEKNENSCIEEKEKSMEVEDGDPQQSVECLNNENETSKEIKEKENENCKEAEETEIEEETIIPQETMSNNENETEKVSKEKEKIEDQAMEIDEKHNKTSSKTEEEIMEIDNDEEQSPLQQNSTIVATDIDAIKSPKDETELDVDKEIEKVLQKRHENTDDEINDKTTTDTDKIIEEIISPNEITNAITDDDISPKKDSEEIIKSPPASDGDNTTNTSSNVKAIV